MPSSPWSRLESVLDQVPEETLVAVSVRHLESGAYFGRDDEIGLPSASTIKLLVLVALARAFDEGRLDHGHLVSPSPEARVAGSGVLTWLNRELALPLRDHAWLMIAISDNTASNVVIDAVGLPAIASTGRDLNLEATALNRCFLGRLPNAGDPDNLAAAADLTRILEAIATGSAASPARCTWMLELLEAQQHRSRIARALPDGITFAGKSGSLPGLVHDSGILTGPSGRLALAVLTSGFEDPYAADAFIAEIANAALSDASIDTGDGP